MIREYTLTIDDPDSFRQHAQNAHGILQLPGEFLLLSAGEDISTLMLANAAFGRFDEGRRRWVMTSLDKATRAEYRIEDTPDGRALGGTFLTLHGTFFGNGLLLLELTVTVDLNGRFIAIKTK